MPNTNPCPTCHAQLDPGTPHTFCARTKAPTTRELEARIAMLEQEEAATNARLEALERAKENTEHGGGGSDSLEVLDGPIVSGSPEPAASALPMPERPDDLDEPWLERHFMCDSINLNEERNGNVRSAESARLYALALESRLAEGEKHRDHLLSLLKHSASRGERLLADRDALKAKLAEAESARDGFENESRNWKHVAHEVDKQRSALEADRDALRAKLDAMSSGIADEQRSRHGLERRVTELEAKLDGVREALSDAISTVGGARRSCVGDHYIHSPQVRLDQVDRWRSALAAAENTNTGSSTVERHAIDESGKAQPVHGSSEGGEVGSIPAPCSPSPAPAFEMTEEQRKGLYGLLNVCTGSFLHECSTWIESLVRSELRKAREGWVTREAALSAMRRVQSRCEAAARSEFNQDRGDTCNDILDSAIRAASKEASDGPR